MKHLGGSQPSGSLSNRTASRRQFSLAALSVVTTTSLAANELYARHSVSAYASLDVPRNWRITSNFNADMDAATRERLRAAGLPTAIPSTLTFSAGRYLESGQALAWLNVRADAEEAILNPEVAVASDADVASLDREFQSLALRAAGASQFSIVDWAGTTRRQISGLTFLITVYERSPVSGTNHTGSSNVVVRLIRLLDGRRTTTLTIAYAKAAEYIMAPIADHIAMSLRFTR